MVKQKESLNETAPPIEISSETQQRAEVTNPKATLAEIRKYPGVIGYILKDSVTATIDLQTPSRLVEYATLASKAFDVHAELSVLFELGDIQAATIECKNLKALCVVMGDCTVNIFMEKNVNQLEILRKVLPQLV